MAFDRFLVGPINTGLQRDLKPFSFKALFGIIKEYTKGCFMKLRKDAIDITGQRFGYLTAIRPEKNGKYRGVKWLCKCICGKETIAFGGHLRAGKRVSCGCKSQEQIYDTGINRLFGMYKLMAKRRGHDFEITRTQFELLVIGNCYYCGLEPKQELKRLKSRKLQVYYNGLDRFDHNKGYTIDNAVSCCYYCNHGKADLSFEEWKEHLKRIFKYQGFNNAV